jgi:hypothetical protein
MNEDYISPEDLEILANAVDKAVRSAIDRAIKRDHTLCGAEPCSDCR